MKKSSIELGISRSRQDWTSRWLRPSCLPSMQVLTPWLAAAAKS